MNNPGQLPAALLAHVQVRSGPIAPADLLPGMQIRLRQGPQGRVVTGELSSRTLKGVTVRSTAGGSISLSEVSEAPTSSWAFTLLSDFEERVLLPGTCAEGTSARGDWQGLWLSDLLGRWEPVRPFDGRVLTVDEAGLRPVQLRTHDLDRPPVPGDLAVVDVCGEQHRGIRWDEVWRLPAVNFTASAHTVHPIAALSR